MKKLTKKWLIEHSACKKAIDGFLAQKETDVIKILKMLIKQGKLEWANRLVTWQMEYKDCISYAVYAAKQVLVIFEKEFPNDGSSRKAIETAERCIKNPTIKNKIAAESAANSAKSAAYSAAYSAESAANSAKSAAYSAAYSAESAANSAKSAAYSAAYSAESAAYSAAYSAKSAAYSAAYSAESAAGKKMRKKILRYGIKLLQRGEKCEKKIR